MKLVQKSLLLVIVVSLTTMVNIHTGFSKEAKLLINEVMSSNSLTIEDEDGDYSDWIELFNPNSSPVDLTGYGLSDRADDPFKWVFPGITLDAGKHFLIFASGKDKKVVVKHWETVITQGDEWKYLVGLSEPSEDWRFLDFDDSGWESGPSGFGFGDDDDTTVVPQTASFFIRKTFNIDDKTTIITSLLQIDYDDGFVAYINGTEIARANITGTVGTPPPYNQTAKESIEAKMYTGGNPSVFSIENVQSLLVTGENVLAIQVHNFNILDKDMTAIPFLTFGMSAPPENPRGTPDILQFSLTTFLHTNFKINASGETLVLSDRYENISDQVDTGYIQSDLSKGRQPDGGSQWLLFIEPTPGKSNITEGFLGFADSVKVSHSGGFYNNSISLSLSTNSDTAEIHYTLDGNDPTESSNFYSDSIPIDTTTVVKARTYDAGYLPGLINTHTYIINDTFTLPVITLATPPANLWDEKIGIYVDKDIGKRKEWERPVHIEFFENDGTPRFSSHATIRLYGRTAINLAQKSLAVFARSETGISDINYQLFPDKPIYEFESFLLRSSSDDWSLTMLRDAMQHCLLEEYFVIDIQAYRPSILLLNGEYMGIHNIREKYNEDYLVSNHGIDPEKIDIVMDDILHEEMEIIAGDSTDYRAMLNYIKNKDMSQTENYDYIKTQMDTDDFIDYIIAEIFIANYSWNHNRKIWRSATATGKWKWLIYDLDRGFTSKYSTYSDNTLEIIIDDDLSFQRLLENQEFKNDFIQRFANHLNFSFKPERVIHIIDSLKTAIEPEMPRHIAKWETLGGISDITTWEDNVEVLRIFARERPSYIRSHITDHFKLSGTAELTLISSDPDGGRISIGDIKISDSTFTGTYFKDVPLQIKAIPNPGYRFAGWAGITSGDTLSTQIYLTGDLSVTAHFERETDSSYAIVFNEINYNSSNDFDTEDWVEFYNPKNSSVDMSGWIFKDEDDTHKFVFPENTIIGPESYLVLLRDMSLFTALFSDVSNYVGDMSFGLSSGGELIRLYNAQGDIVDILTYDNNLPWPEAADGGGATLSLRSPELDNSLPESWAISVKHGTPGKKNEYIVLVEEANHPTELSLAQNYPNPFNQVTVIPFYIPEAGKVTVELYSVLGQRVAKILDKNMPAGHHNIKFKAHDLASGIYFCTVTAGGTTKTKQMMYLK
ncbi:CotH kinase family protein [Candidatus Latescibacterota bacterium]